MLALVLALAAFLVLLLGTLYLLVRRGRRRVQAQLAALDEPFLRGPESAIYRGGTGPYPKVNGNGCIVLTRTRLVCTPYIGRGVDIPLSEITGLREDVWFRRSMSGGKMHLIVQTAAGEVGFFVVDNAGWIAAINPRLTHPV